jgi:hypothetical protein
MAHRSLDLRQGNPWPTPRSLAEYSLLLEVSMVEKSNPESVSAPLERIPFMQRLLDNPFLLLFTVIYILWGVMEITQIPLAK